MWLLVCHQWSASTNSAAFRCLVISASPVTLAPRGFFSKEKENEEEVEENKEVEEEKEDENEEEEESGEGGNDVSFIIQVKDFLSNLPQRIRKELSGKKKKIFISDLSSYLLPFRKKIVLPQLSVSLSLF